LSKNKPKEKLFSYGKLSTEGKNENETSNSQQKNNISKDSKKKSSGSKDRKDQSSDKQDKIYIDKEKVLKNVMAQTLMLTLNS
jgi:hypothetical protein